MVSIKQAFLIVLTILSMSPWKNAIFSEASYGISYGFSKGRFGDNLLTVAHSIYLAHCLDLPVIYRPFPFAENLKLGSDSSFIHNFENKKLAIKLTHNSDYIKLFKSFCKNEMPFNSLVMLPYYAEDVEETPLFMQVDWDDFDFLKILRRVITPLIPIPTYEILPEHTSVAMHIRTGVGYDSAHTSLAFPLKLPPRQYYIDALKLLSNVLGLSLHVYIFTDDPHPDTILKEFQTRFQDYPFVFSIPRKASIKNLDVLEDFFSLGQFECLIRSTSNFSFMASKLFPFRAAISPAHYERKENNLPIIDQFLLEMRPISRKQQPLRLQLSQPL